MCSLQNLSEEYLCDALRLEQRIALLESQASRTISLEVRRKLRRRINALYTMACESRQTAFLLEHYYDKPKEAVFYVPCSTQSHRSGKRFSRHGYGAASPALIMHGRNADKTPVSGLRTELTRGYDAKRNR